MPTALPQASPALMDGTSRADRWDDEPVPRPEPLRGAARDLASVAKLPGGFDRRRALRGPAELMQPGRNDAMTHHAVVSPAG
ncbi:hypothetical protein MB84_30490 (plasmid) [Pandoraea oxalativorans]|uniref:Uncharacterized protein n=1 Tax=Pandoraea oxalativorans TaxID=573737 RepID=A0A0G3IIZ0_9BURK|nr:hypothetical protein MB84_30490 [Pandoraea oxalativorans]